MATVTTPIVLDLGPVAIEVPTTRGDNPIMTFTMQEAGVDKNIAGFGYLFTVDTREDPDNSDTLVFQLIGAVVSPNVAFQATVVQTDLDPDTEYFCDIQETNVAGDILTVAKGKFIVGQDITK